MTSSLAVQNWHVKEKTSYLSIRPRQMIGKFYIIEVWSLKIVEVHQKDQIRKVRREEDFQIFDMPGLIV